MAKQEDILLKVNTNSSPSVKELDLPGQGQGVLTRGELAKAANFEKFVKSIKPEELGELLVSYSKLKDTESLLKTIRVVVPDTQNAELYLESAHKLGAAFDSAMTNTKPYPGKKDENLGPVLEPIFKAIEKVSREETSATPKNKIDYARGPVRQRTLDSEIKFGMSKRNADRLNDIHPSGG